MRIVLLRRGTDIPLNSGQLPGDRAMRSRLSELFGSCVDWSRRVEREVYEERYLSTRRAYSSIFIRRIKSSLTFSNDLRSPSSRAIRAFRPGVVSSVVWPAQKEDEPASQHVQFPIHFCPARIFAIRFANNEAHLRACSPARFVAAVGVSCFAGQPAAVDFESGAVAAAD